MRLLLLAVILSLPAAPAWPRAGGGGGGGGGCFPAGTPVLTLTGEIPIEKVRPGIKVLAFANDNLLQCEVVNFIEKKDRLIRIKTGKGTLTATSEHPLLTPFGFTEVRDLRKGDEVGVFENGRRVWTRIKSIKTGGVAQVYNLEVGLPHTFIAGGFIVHNKGGSFGGGYSRSYSSGYSSGYHGRRRSNTFFDKIMLLIGALIVGIKGYARFSGQSGGGGTSSPGGGGSGGRVDPARLSPRSARTREILASLARRDKDFSPDELQQWVRDIFLKVQLAWQARDYSTLRGVMMPYMHASHSGKVEAMKARGETNMIEDLQVLGLDFVHVRCPAEKEGRAFSVLITASARDYTINDRYGSQARPPEPSVFQEFWTFNQLNGSWALARIDQVGDLDYFNAPNLPDSPEAAAAVPRKEARPAGDAAYQPPGFHERPAPAEDNTFEQGADLLRSLAPAAALAAAAPQPPVSPPEPAGDRWNRQKMEIAATLAFESVYEAWGSNDSTLLNRDFVSGEALEKLKQVMRDRKTEGLSFEFKNLFTRRAEVVLTSPAERSRLHLDEFTARITATAVRAILRNGKVLRRDESPEPFTEYWVFGRQADCWKLRDILPRMEQAAEDHAQDGAPSPVQIEWYWRS
jgi:predicted lipid-binding transport protein (Tim44 family)